MIVRLQADHGMLCHAVSLRRLEHRLRQSGQLRLGIDPGRECTGPCSLRGSQLEGLALAQIGRGLERV